MPSVNNEIAKQKSIELLQVSIATMCSTLGIDYSQFDSSYAIPVDTDHRLYRSYESLLQMQNTLDGLI